MLEDFSFFCFKALTRKEGKGRRTPGQTRGKKDTDDSVQRQLKYLKKHSTKPSTAGEASLCIYIYIYIVTPYHFSCVIRMKRGRTVMSGFIPALREDIDGK